VIDTSNTKITPEVAAALKSYVYVYIDPRNGQPFYIGNGQGNRLFSHLDDKAETEKTATIAAIRAAGHESRIDILRYRLSESEAALVEAAAIDLVGLGNLTNRVAGSHGTSLGRIKSQEVIDMLNAKPVDVRHKALLITINKLYRSDMTPEELYEATRGVWVIGTRREEVDYAIAVYQGIAREVYRIRAWHPAGTLAYRFRSPEAINRAGRWEFEGEVDDDIRLEYVGNFVGKGGQNPIRYRNV
jgi:hypothetical protein